MRHGIISSCQSAATSEIALLFESRKQRDETVESRRVGGVYTNLQLVGDSFVVLSV